MDDSNMLKEMNSHSNEGTKLSLRDFLSHSATVSNRDEEALTWAALEKLPTYDRVRKAILNNADNGRVVEIDVKKLGLQERKGLLDRLFKVVEDDNEKFLLKLKERMDLVGIENPTIEVRFENLHVKAGIYVGNRGVPTIFNYFANKIEEAMHHLHVFPNRKRTITILNDISGVIKPSRMTLLLGPPGSGKTTLLLALAGKLNPTMEVYGKVTYNGHGMDEMIPQRTCAYVSQYDLHIGQMTVRETLAFSARCQGTGTRYDMLTELVRREKAANIKPDPDIDLYMKASSLQGQEEVITDYILKVLGLEMCSDIMVGDAMTRGVSGGQRKRVTTGEMLVGPAKALFMDEVSTGLDSSTTFQIMKSISHYVHILGGTALISLLQPAPETYELFDDIILLSDGQIVYQGPREHVLEFFESMGFRCPERKGVADFLQEVTSRKDQQQYWNSRYEYHFVSVQEFSEAFQSFHVGCQLQHELDTPFDKRNNHPAALTKTNYGVGKIELLRACMAREFLLMKRNSFVYITKLLQLFVLACVTMTVFLRTKMQHDTTEDGQIYLGVIYVGLVAHLFNGFAELPMSITRLPVLYKQRDLLFYPAWAYAVPAWLLKIPISVTECALWVVMTYYTVGFDPDIQRMFRQFLLLTLVSQTAFGLFRFLAALGREMVTGFTFGAFVQLILLALGGFLLSRDQIKKWWIWGYWCSPMMYATNAAAVNEFLGKQWTHVINETGNTSTLGVQVLKSRGLFHDPYWYWIGVGALIGYMILLNVLTILALTYLNPIGKGQPILSEEALNEMHANRTGEYLQTSAANKNHGWCSMSKGSGGTSIAVASIDFDRKRGMVLPFMPLSITFENIKYSIDMPAEMQARGIKDDRLLLLKGLTGAFRPGVLTALMGVSGAGKTTLMDVLAGRKTGGYIEGSIKISGYPKKQETFARVSGYCEQNDIHSPHVTLYESLVYSAWLRLAPEVDTTSRNMFVEKIMELVELTTLRNAMVGLPGVSGLSTEQRKRLTIAVELVANPSIIFMDEPTSGLDARAAAIVMRTVRNIVDTGRTVVCTIHQPSIDIFEAFDELFLMKRGGEEIYVGPLGRHSSHLIKYFEAIHGVSKIKDGYNPATWMLELATEGQEVTLGINFAEIYKKSELFRRNRALVDELNKPNPRSTDLHFTTRYPQSFLVQCVACLWKQHKSYWRNPGYSSTRIVFTAITGLIFGTMFWKLGSKMMTLQDLFNSMSSMFASVFFIGVQNAQMVQPLVDVERTVFYREKAAGMYSALPYALGQVFIEIPYVFLQAVMYAVMVYAMIDFEWSAAKFFWYLFFAFTSFMYFTLYGMMSVALTPNSDIASVASSVFYGIWNLFAGFVIPRTRIPIWWRWYYWACPLSWTVYGLFASQFGDIKVEMDTGETVEAYLMRYFGFQHDFLGMVAGVVIFFNLLFIFIFTFAIKTLNFQKR